MRFDCVVIGAGLAGIVAARDLEDSGKSVLLIEASDDVGGRVRSDHVDGFILDRGFQVINPRYPQVKRTNLIRDLDFKVIPPKVKLADIDMYVGLTPSSFSKEIGSITEKTRFLRFIASTAPSNSNAFADYTRHFPVLYKKVLKPFLTGVFLNDPEEIAADVVHEILRSFVKSLPGVPANGVGEFSKALAKPLKNVLLNEKVISIQGNLVMTTNASYHGEFIVVATDSKNAQNLIPKSSACKMLSSYTYYFVVDDDPDLRKHLHISTYSRAVNAIMISKISRNYAPEGKHLISVTSLSPLSQAEFCLEASNLLGIPSTKMEYIKHYEIINSLPFHGPGRRRNENLLIGDNTYLIGDHMAVPSQDGAMRTGAQVAQMINQLKR
jgi:phytoene dehydrogenase-like protein